MLALFENIRLFVLQVENYSIRTKWVFVSPLIFGNRSASSMSKWRPAWTLTPEMIPFRTKSVTLSVLIDLIYSLVQCHVDRRRWRSHQLTSDLKRCLLFRKCLRWSSRKAVSFNWPRPLPWSSQWKINTWKGLNSVSDPLIQTLFRIRLDRSPFQLDNKTIEPNKGWKKAFHSRWVGRLTGWIRTSPLRGSVLIVRSDTHPPGYEYLIRCLCLS